MNSLKTGFVCVDVLSKHLRLGIEEGQEEPWIAIPGPRFELGTSVYEAWVLSTRHWCLDFRCFYISVTTVTDLSFSLLYVHLFLWTIQFLNLCFQIFGHLIQKQWKYKYSFEHLESFMPLFYVYLKFLNWVFFIMCPHICSEWQK